MWYIFFSFQMPTNMSNSDLYGKSWGELSDQVHRSIIDICAYLDPLHQWDRTIVSAIQLSIQPASKKVQVWQCGTHTNNLHTSRGTLTRTPWNIINVHFHQRNWLLGPFLEDHWLKHCIITYLAVFFWAMYWILVSKSSNRYPRPESPTMCSSSTTTIPANWVKLYF